MIESKKSTLTRRKILDVGRNLVTEHGFGGVGLSQILRESGAPKGSFYYYFESKEAFGKAILDDYIVDYLSRVDALFAAPGTAHEKLDRFWGAWHSTETSNGIAKHCLVVKLGAEVSDLSETMRETLNHGVNQLVSRIYDLLILGANDGSIRVFSDPKCTAKMLYAKWIGAALLAKISRDETPLIHAHTDTKQLLSTQNK